MQIPFRLRMRARARALRPRRPAAAGARGKDWSCRPRWRRQRRSAVRLENGYCVAIDTRLPRLRKFAKPTSRPFHHRRHRGQDRIDIAAGAQPEHGATVVEEVELDIAPAPHELLLALRLAPRRREIAAHEVGIDLEEGTTDVLGEGEVGIPVAGIEPVVEDAADAAHLLAVLEIEILVAPGLEFLIGRDRG